MISHHVITRVRNVGLCEGGSTPYQGAIAPATYPPSRVTRVRGVTCLWSDRTDLPSYPSA